MSNTLDNLAMRNRLLAIAKAFHHFCTENGLEYFMMSGTLLGAVRHKGFIPWDDDMDFGMLPEFYKALQEKRDAFADQYPDYEILIPGDEDYYYPFVKIVDKTTTVHQTFASSKKVAIGVYIDVFEFCGMPDRGKEAKKMTAKLRNLYRMSMCALDYGMCMREAVNAYKSKKFGLSKYTLRICQYTVLAIIGKVIGYKRITQHLIKQGEKYDIDKTAYIYDPAGRNIRGVIPKEYILDGTQPMQFEDTTFLGLKEYDKYLTAVYGDYMTPPKEKERHTHSSIFVDLNLPYREYKRQ